MNRTFLNIAVFLAGLAVVCWIAIGYAASNPLALTVTLLIGAIYLTGAFELRQYHQASATLAQAVANAATPPASLAGWLDGLHPSLRNAVRLRVEGERVALPGPVLTPYLVGLLVLLGMLGTLLGMVATLKGTGLALASATDLQAIRASLAAPVRGLGFAFGTSVAGVATSAMLGLLSALCRRERIHTAQALDARIATTLHVHSRAHRRDEAFQLLQRQAEAMPALVDRLQAMMTAMAQQTQAMDARLAANQEAFHGKAEAAYASLAASVAQSLKDSVAASAQAAGAALQPAVEATMASLARETSAWRDTLTQTVAQQVDDVATRFAGTTAAVAAHWNDALAMQQRTHETLSADLRTSLERYADTFEQRTAQLLNDIAARVATTSDGVAATWRDALAQHTQANDQLADNHRQALAATVTAFEQHATGVMNSMARLTDNHRQALEAASATFEQHAAKLLHSVDASHAALQTALASRDEQRLTAWADRLDTLAASLRAEWAQASEQAVRQQQIICETLAQTANDISTQTQAHASGTIAEIERLVQAAAQAPKAAADVIGELRQKLSDSMARDNAMLDERNRLLETLGTLLDAVNHASTEQRVAVDALIATSTDLLERTGTRFTDNVEGETAKLAAVAAQIAGGAAEVASLGEAFGAAVQQFSTSNDTLVAHLQRIEAALGKSMARSDEQLAYYVAQAREVIELSMMSQKQIVDDLQQLASRQATHAPHTATNGTEAA